MVMWGFSDDMCHICVCNTRLQITGSLISSGHKFQVCCTSNLTISDVICIVMQTVALLVKCSQMLLWDYFIILHILEFYFILLFWQFDRFQPCCCYCFLDWFVCFDCLFQSHLAVLLHHKRYNSQQQQGVCFFPIRRQKFIVATISTSSKVWWSVTESDGGSCDVSPWRR